MLEKSNTWPEQVLDTLNSCWRALFESLSNTQANVRFQSLARRLFMLAMLLAAHTCCGFAVVYGFFMLFMLRVLFYMKMLGV